MKNVYQRCFLNSGICLAAQISEQRKCLAASISRRRGGGGRLEIEAAKHFLCSDIWARYTSNYTVQKTALVWWISYRKSGLGGVRIPDLILRTVTFSRFWIKVLYFIALPDFRIYSRPETRPIQNVIKAHLKNQIWGRPKALAPQPEDLVFQMGSGVASKLWHIFK